MFYDFEIDVSTVGISLRIKLLLIHNFALYFILSSNEQVSKLLVSFVGIFGEES